MGGVWSKFKHKKYNYSNKGLKGGYWSSSLDSKTLVDSADFTNLYITIRDNGVGFNPTEIEKGNGLINMEKRIEDIADTI